MLLSPAEWINCANKLCNCNYAVLFIHHIMVENNRKKNFKKDRKETKYYEHVSQT